MKKLLFTYALAVVVPVVASAVTMDMVTVGNVGNAPDPLNTNAVLGIGSVDYMYAMGKFEVMNSQYAEFLNSVAATDTYGLYNPGMSSEARGGIIRSGLSGQYTYAPKSGYEGIPVIYVSIYDAVRFVNWLENGQPTGAQGVGTTETGSYTLFTNGSSTTNVSARAANATWVIPTENEWYKAAYHQPAGSGGPTDSYWLYPMQSDGAKYSDQPPGASCPDPSVAGNFYRDDALPNGYNDGYAVTGGSTIYSWQNYLTQGGAYSAAGSFYGTFDQAGNVWEMTETLVTSNQVARGGSWRSGELGLPSPDRAGLVAVYESDDLGFRVAMIPEPHSAVWMLIAAMGLGLRFVRRRSRR